MPYALRFHYGPNDSSAPDAWAERELHISDPQLEYWLRFDLRVADNYHHRSVSPSNNKLMAVFMDDYSSNGDGPTVIWEMWSNGNGGSSATVHYSSGNHRAANAHVQSTSFIQVPRDRGRWMTVVFRVIAASSRGANNGTIEMWRRWRGDSGWSKFHELTSADIAPPPGGPNGWRVCKILGWSNSGFSRDTYMFVDNVRVADASLLTDD